MPQLPQHSSFKPKGVKPAWEGLTSPGRDSLGEAVAPAAYRRNRQSHRASFGDVLVAGELLEEAWAHIAVRSPLGHRPGAGPKRSGAPCVSWRMPASPATPQSRMRRDPSQRGASLRPA